ncbi:MAG: holo-ACP synthase [Eubacteriales bacterium]|nr:holo-ACP synthase [Eubacteriales bacterium]
MIKGIGVDAVEIGRFDNLVDNERFMSMIYTDVERRLIAGSPRRAASTFAAKEAVAKVSGYGFKACRPEEIEILRNQRGAPTVRLYGKTKELFSHLKIDFVHLSLTDTRQTATAFAVGSTKEEEL